MYQARSSGCRLRGCDVIIKDCCPLISWGHTTLGAPSKTCEFKFPHACPKHTVLPTSTKSQQLLKSSCLLFCGLTKTLPYELSTRLTWPDSQWFQLPKDTFQIATMGFCDPRPKIEDDLTLYDSSIETA